MIVEDQATKLRGLADRVKHRSAPEIESGNHAFTIALTGGKGGVGKSTLALNLAIALSQLDQKVCLLDATPGLGNLDLLCGLNCYWNLSHVISGARLLNEVITAGPEGVDIVVGANDLSQLDGLPASTIDDICSQVQQLEMNYDVVILDAGNALHSSTKPLLSLADLFMVVSTAEPTAIADAYASIKRLATVSSNQIEVLVNQVDEKAHAEKIFERVESTSRLFVQTRVQYAGVIPFDVEMRKAISRRTPLMTYASESPAAEAIRKMSRRLMGTFSGTRSGSSAWKEFVATSF